VSSAYLSACAIFRDEGPYLREWIEFHRLVGVEHFYLYDNQSSDDGPEIVEEYVATGVATLRRWSGVPGQLSAYFDAVVRARQSNPTRWLAFLDIDEFLFSPTGRSVADLLIAYAEAPAVGVNWHVYGTNGHVAKPDGLVIENYTRRTLDDGWNRHIKSIVQPARTAMRRPADPHHFQYVDGFAVNEWREPISGPFSDPTTGQLLRINHYWSKSEDEAIAKAGRRRADNGELRDVRSLLDPRLNVYEDLSILPYVPALKALGVAA
jgi:hypothetical protein